MSLNYDIFGELSPLPEPPSKGRPGYQSMQSIHGIKDGSDTCKTCRYCVGYCYNGKIYYKCEKGIVSHSSATDIRLKNRACNLYIPR